MGRRISSEQLAKVLSDQVVQKMASYVLKGEGLREPLVGVNYRFPVSLKRQLDLASEVTGLDRTQIMVAALTVLLPRLLALSANDSNEQAEPEPGREKTA